MPQLTRTDDVFVLNLGDGENRFAPPWMTAVRDAITEVSAAAGPRALVTTATGKFFSNGLDLDWMRTHPDRLDVFSAQLHDLLAQVVAADVITVAAIQGHAFAGGAILALAHDYRVMRADRGFFCLPEIDLQIPFTPGMLALIDDRLPSATARDLILTGRRYGGRDALTAGIVDAIADECDVLPTAIQRAQALAAKHPGTIGTIKARRHSTAIDGLRAASAS